MNQDTNFSSSLARIIQAEQAQLRSYSALEEAIKLAGAPVAVSRKQLKSLAKREPARLSTEQLDALDTYLRVRRSKSLVTLLAEYDDRLLTAVARCQQARFMLGERPRGPRERHARSLSKWDFDSMAGFLQGMYSVAHTSAVKLRFSEVGMNTGSIEITADTYRGLLGELEWYGLLDSYEHPIICLGSPRSCHAAELLLGRMFGVQPFEQTPAMGLPFYFGWAKDGYFRHGCSFVRHHAAGPDAGEGREKAPWEDRSIILAGGEEFRMRNNGTSWTSYGVVAAQRLPGGPSKIRAVFCGLSGPETRGAAGVAAQIELPPLPAVGSSGVAWAVVETVFNLKKPNDPASPRSFVSSRVVERGVWSRA